MSSGPGRVRVYLSASTVRTEELRRYAEELEAEGLEIVSSWLSTVTKRPAAAAASADLADLRRADAFVCFTQGPGNPHQGRGGRHVELGAALERGITVVVVGEPEHVFHELEGVERFGSWEEARARSRVPGIGRTASGTGSER